MITTIIGTLILAVLCLFPMCFIAEQVGKTVLWLIDSWKARQKPDRPQPTLHDCDDRFTQKPLPHRTTTKKEVELTE